MRIQSTLPAIALLALTAALPLFTASAAPLESGSVLEFGDDDSPLHEAMESLKGGQRAVKKLIADPVANHDELMATLRSMESATMTALASTPKAPEDLSGKALELFNVDFKSEIATLLQNILALQTATLNGDAAALASGYEALSATKKSGHDKFRVDD
jgi:hypothetical protein